MQNQTSGPEWLTVKQYAVASGCTTQAIYKKLATSLQPYTKQENGRTLINSAALNATKLQPVDNPATVDNQLQTVAAIAERAQLDALRDQISRQAAEIDQQRAQLDRMRTELTGTRLDRERLTAELAAATRRADDAEAREQATAAAAAERERAADQRAQDAAALAAERERTAAAQLSEALQALTAAQQHAAERERAADQREAELTAALAAAQSLHAGTIRGQLDTAAQRPADDQSDGPQPGDDAHSTVRTDADSSTRSAGQPAGDQTDDQPPKRRGLFARLFRRG